MTVNEDGIEIGMTGCFSVGSDRYLYKVISVTKKTFGVVKLFLGKNKKRWPEQDYEVDLDQETPTEPTYIVRNLTLRSEGFPFSFPKFCTAEELGACAYLDPSF